MYIENDDKIAIGTIIKILNSSKFTSDVLFLINRFYECGCWILIEITSFSNHETVISTPYYYSLSILFIDHITS